MNASNGSSARWVALLVAIAALFGSFFLVVRPWYLSWGATASETRRPLPGDSIIPDPTFQQTRAITIHAPVDQVWPWIAQIGQDRGGFYSYDLLENLVGCRMPTADYDRPEKQIWHLGDKLWMYPKEKAGGQGFATLREFVPGRALAFGARAYGTPSSKPENGTWAMVLEPVDASTTRFLIRGRGPDGRSLLGVFFDQSFFEPVHFVMERRMMIGIRQLAEGTGRGRLVNHAMVVVWAATFLMMFVAMALVLHLKAWGRALVAVFATGIAFQILTLRQPPLLIAVALALGLLAFLRWCVRADDAVGPALPGVADVPPSRRLDRWLPDAPFNDVILARASAAPERVMQAWSEVTPREMPLAWLVGTIRYAPGRLAPGGARGRVGTALDRPFVPAIASGKGSVVLESAPNEHVVGTVGKLHQIRDQQLVALHTPAEFASFDAPDHERLAMSFRAMPEPGTDKTLLVFEHRTQPTDEGARRRFARYWLAIRPGGAFVTRELLKAVARRAERTPAPVPTDTTNWPREEEIA